MRIRNPFKNLKKSELILWVCSLIAVSASFLFSKEDCLTLIASLTGVTALIFVAVGDVFGQILTVVFSLFYALISFKFRYYGEMITYLGMTMPIAVLSVISWVKHPYKNTSQVKVHSLSKRQIVILLVLTAAVTVGFYFILKAFDTPNLIVSTVSIATSFSASFLMFLRSPFYAVAYALNDAVLIVLWVLAATESISYLPMIVCFSMFLINDLYGFYNWCKMKKRQDD